MRIVLRSDVDNLGHKGDLLEVADGYARNYLVPRGLAIQATKGAVKQAEAMRRSRQQREIRDRQHADEVAVLMTARPVRISARAGATGKLFGSVTAAEVAEAASAQLGVELDRRKLHLEEPLREIGPHEVTIRLHPEVEATMVVEVVPE